MTIEIVQVKKHTQLVMGMTSAYFEVYGVSENPLRWIVNERAEGLRILAGGKDRRYWTNDELAGTQHLLEEYCCFR